MSTRVLLPWPCVPILRDCLERELRERGMRAGSPFRAVLERIGYVGQRDVQLDLGAHGWAVETALRRRVRQQRHAEDTAGRARMLGAEAVLATLGLPDVPDVRRTRA
jgi:hypothetical protein